MCQLTVHVGQVAYFAGSAIMYPENGLDVYQVYDVVRSFLSRAEDRALTIATNSRDVIDLIALESQVETSFVLHRQDRTTLTLSLNELREAIRVSNVDFRKL